MPILFSHPAPGHKGPDVVTEYTATEWATGEAGRAYDSLTRECLDNGARVRIGERIVVNPIAFYRRFIGETERKDAAA